MFCLVVFVGSLLLGVAYLLALKPVFASEALKRKNYRGKEIWTSCGIVFIMVSLTFWLIVQILGNYRLAGMFFREFGYGIYVFSVLVIGFGLFGFIDDVAGGEGTRGFKGHLRQVFRGGMTTGLLKAFGGFLVALLVAVKVSFYPGISTINVMVWIMNAVLIALTANFFNLLDLRPGRALKVFLPAAALVLGLALRYKYILAEPIQETPIPFFVAPMLMIVAVALVLFPGDLREKFMIGDAGSNVLGATVGLGLVLGTPPWWRLGILVFVLAITLISEIYSFSAVIERNRVLNYLDMLGRKG